MASPPRGRVLGFSPPEEPTRPLMDRWIGCGYGSDVPPPPDPGRCRLIGLEIRLRRDGIQEEVKLVPLDIELRGMANAASLVEFGPCTLHTTVGDVTIPAVRIPASGF